MVLDSLMRLLERSDFGSSTFLGRSQSGVFSELKGILCISINTEIPFYQKCGFTKVKHPMILWWVYMKMGNGSRNTLRLNSLENPMRIDYFLSSFLI